MIMENIDYLIEYDRSDPISIETYSQKLIGKTFREIWEEDDARQPMMVREDSAPYGSSEVAETKRNKGNLGQIIEEKFPELVREDSPTHRVGGVVLDSFNKITHKIPMMSLGDVFNEEEIKEMKKRHILQAKLMQSKVIERLQNLNSQELTTSDCARMYDVAVKVERLSRGCEDNKVEVNNKVMVDTKEVLEQRKLENLSEEELEELERLTQKMNKKD